MNAVALNLIEVIVPLGICVVLPVMVVWLGMRKKTNDTNKRTELILAILDKNPNADVEEYLKKLETPAKSVKEKLLKKLQTACVLIALGLVLILINSVDGLNSGSLLSEFDFMGAAGLLLLLLGLAFLVVYFVSKKTLAKELEAENKRAEQ